MKKLVTGRLELIAKSVPECKFVCDIGTDHAYIPIFLIKNNICKKAIASDIKIGPIKVANKNIKLHNLEAHISTRLSNGLEMINYDELDVLVIAGMGGALISEILNNASDKAKKASMLILQPMNNIELVRKWLYDNGFDITEEWLTSEKEKVYNVIKSKWNNSINKKDIINYYIGEKLLEKNDILLEKYLKIKLFRLDKITTQMKNSKCLDTTMFEELLKVKDEMLKILQSKGDNH